MTDTPTAAELERAKRWAAMQVPPVTLVEIEYEGSPIFYFKDEPAWLADAYHDTPEEAWTYLASVFASLAPVLFEEAANVAERHYIPGHSVAGLHFAEQCAAAIRSLAAKEPAK